MNLQKRCCFIPKFQLVFHYYSCHNPCGSGIPYKNRNAIDHLPLASAQEVVNSGVRNLK